MNTDISQVITQAQDYLMNASQEEVVRVIREICAKRPELADALAETFAIASEEKDV